MTERARPCALLSYQLLLCNGLDRRIVVVYSRIIKDPASDTCNLQVYAAIYAWGDYRGLEDISAPQDLTRASCIDIWADTNS
jgi:hypothetical protein